MLHADTIHPETWWGHGLFSNNSCWYPGDTNGAKASNSLPDSKVHGANVGPTWGRQYSGGPHVGRVNFAIQVGIDQLFP